VAGLTLGPAARQAGQTPPAAQQPSLTFRAVANYVEIDAIVTDRQGHFVRNLQPSDFEVFEDGRAQRLSVCALVDIPIDRPDPLLFRASTVPVDVVTNDKAFDGRVFMIVLDGYHVASGHARQAQEQARLFIERYMGENDLAAVVHIGAPTSGQEFTSNKRLLLASIDRFGAQALQGVTQNLIADSLLKQVVRSEGVDPGQAEDRDSQTRAYLAQQSLGSMRRLSDYLGGLSGRRKALLLFSEGIAYDTMDHPADPQTAGDGASDDKAGRRILVRDAEAVRTAQEDMIAAATRANVSIYTIDPRGLVIGSEQMAAMPAVPIAANETRNGVVPVAPSYSLRSMAGDFAEELRLARESLRLFADRTGGRTVADQNDPGAGFDRIIEDNSAYYVLGYDSPDAKRDGRFHRVSLKVRQPGLEVRARTGYYSPVDNARVTQPVDAKSVVKGRTAPLDKVSQMLLYPAPMSGLGMRVNASVVKGLFVKGTVHLTLELSGKDVGLSPENGRSVSDVDVEYLAVNTQGKSEAGGRDLVHLSLLPATRDAFEQQGVRYVTEFQVAPGRYQVRVAARERVGGRTGSVFCDIEMPDFAAGPLAMSDLLLTASTAGATRTGRSTAGGGVALPGPTTTAREFRPTETLSVLAGIYDNVSSSPHAVDLKTTVESDAGTKVFLREDQRESKDLVTARGGYSYVVSVPLTGLAPGRYVLTVEAQSRLGGDPVRKETEFRVK
jgi:VWFA-related protein